MPPRLDALVIGAGPNGIAAALTLQRAGLATQIYEANERAGGGAITSELTLPGFQHDDCSAIHPLALASPLFRELQLERHGLRWVGSPAPLAHVLDEHRTVTLERSVAETAAQLGRDGEPYRRLMEPFVQRFEELIPMVLGPLRWPEHPALMARFGLQAIRSMRDLAAAWFHDPPAAALLAGIASHALVPLASAVSASFALVLGSAGHACGWPLAQGGSAAIIAALLQEYTAQGGTLVLSRRVRALYELPPARAYLFDLAPGQFSAIAGDELPRSYLRRLAAFRHGPGAFKMDWALSAPIPWRDPRCARAATVHLSGTLGQMACSEDESQRDGASPEPFLLLAQPSLFDPTRAPPGKHTAWAYCHVPNGSSLDRRAAIEQHIERFAPGFGELVLARSTRTARQLEIHDLNLVGGDVSGGLPSLSQLFFRPVARLDPYATPNPKLFLCSASTPPGGGVHGMCGYWAARSVLRSLARSRVSHSAHV